MSKIQIRSEETGTCEYDSMKEALAAKWSEEFQEEEKRIKEGFNGNSIRDGSSRNGSL